VKILFFVALWVVSAVSFAGSLINQNSAGVFLDGYDVVSYFNEEKPKRGLKVHSLTWADTELHFVSDENRQLFVESPDSYFPQFAGHCANGLSDGHLVRAKPEIYRIIDGQLYLFFSWWGKAQWKFDQQEQIALATDYWEIFSGAAATESD
jgi:hypothetical protein